MDALSDPGNIDITSDVDFEELALSGAQISNGKISLKLAEIYISFIISLAHILDRQVSVL